MKTMAREKKTHRRQNKSCDQCRRGKRACDSAPNLNIACSNCTRTKKICTFEDIRQKGSRIDSSPQFKRDRRFIQTKEAYVASAGATGQFQSAKKLLTTTNISLVHNNIEPWIIDGDYDVFGPESVPSVPDSYPHEKSRDNQDDSQMITDPLHLWQLPSVISSDPFSDDYDLNGNFQFQDPEVVNDTLTSTRGPYFINNEDTPYQILESADSILENIVDSSENTRVESQHHITNAQVNPFQSSISPKSSTYFDEPWTYSFIENTNRCLISRSLDRVFNDTFENALLCWLTEQTCPYTYEGIEQRLDSTSISGEYVQGSSDAGRILSRVRQLDQPASGLFERPLTFRERKIACRALRATTMAFAAQWSQCSDTGTATASLSAQSSGSQYKSQKNQKLHLIEKIQQKLGSFDRQLQESLWNDAYRALQDAVGIESFQVVFARLIFSFTQKPMSSDRLLLVSQSALMQEKRGPCDSITMNSSEQVKLTDGSKMNTACSEMQANCGQRKARQSLSESDVALANEENAYQMELALISLSAKRVRLNDTDIDQAEDTQLGNGKPTSSICSERRSEDRKTFNQLFWLLMMCDTLCATINNRSPIVSDEDSVVLSDVDQYTHRSDRINSADMLIPQAPTSPDSQKEIIHIPNPWGSYFLDSVGPQKRSGVAEWPCSFEDASRYLAEAAPIKVLLFRRIKQLQNLLFRKAPSQKIENAIRDALAVYEHWNGSYGNFFKNCIANHHCLPSRIQSWYAILVGHWHLAALLLADLVEKIDQSKKACSLNRSIRQACDLVFEIRKQSTLQMGLLGEVAGAQKDSSFCKSGDFHFAVNEGALLTEPWTEILIRSFAKCSEQLLDWRDHCLYRESQKCCHDSRHDIEQLRTCCSNCIAALFALGRKSDASYVLACAFQQRLLSNS